MKKRTPLTLFSVSIVCLTLFLGGQAFASVSDHFFGRVAQEGTTLHGLGTLTLEANHGETTYFTNGHGRVLKVAARRDDEEHLRVSVERTYIPVNYIAGTQQSTRDISAIYSHLHELAGKGDTAGEYTLIPGKDGEEAFGCGVAIAEALDNE